MAETIMINMTPSWRGVMPLLIAGLTDGSDTARKIATEELYRLADAADAANTARADEIEYEATTSSRSEFPSVD